jgi:hypothetical protein
MNGVYSTSAYENIKEPYRRSYGRSKDEFMSIRK